MIEAKACFFGVLSDVVAQASELAFVTHQMVKGVLLPKAALGAEMAIDLPSGEMFPGVALFDHRDIVGERGEQMDVIRHDDEVEHLVAITVEVRQAVGDEVCDLGLSEDARAVAGVECFMPAGGEAVVVFDHQVGRKFLDPQLPAFLGGIDSVVVEPAIAICPLAFENVFGHGV